MVINYVSFCLLILSSASQPTCCHFYTANFSLQVFYFIILKFPFAFYSLHFCSGFSHNFSHYKHIFLWVFECIWNRTQHPNSVFPVVRSNRNCSTFLVFHLLLYTEKFGASLIHEQFRDHQRIWASLFADLGGLLAPSFPKLLPLFYRLTALIFIVLTPWASKTEPSPASSDLEFSVTWSNKSSIHFFLS